MGDSGKRADTDGPDYLGDSGKRAYTDGPDVPSEQSPLVFLLGTARTRFSVLCREEIREDFARRVDQTVSVDNK